MELGIKGKRALITGASSGLGAAAALALAQEGVEVAINSRNLERLSRSADNIRRATGMVPRLAVGDVSRGADIQKIADDIGEVDILVSNAGGPPSGDFLDHPGERWLEAADLVLHSAINLTRAFLEGMKERGWGRLIYITSIGVLQPIDSLILSNTYRAGVTGFCKTISNNYAKYGITANCVCPGYTATERLWELARRQAEQTGRTAEQVMESFAAASPAGRVGQPEEPASLIVFLASERAAYITGASIPVDGGVKRALI
ncbi:MAG: SDR family oxidoreductase [Candidatus Zixiibacteriota bacterium]